jgi:hypothetical protein
MTKPTPRADLVKAVCDAAAIVGEALPVRSDDDAAWQQEMRTLQAAALPVILRELLDVEVTA